MQKFALAYKIYVYYTRQPRGNYGEYYMKTFLKDYSYSMVKLFLNQIAITLFATMVSIATFSDRKILLAISIFSVLFFLYLNYTSLWELGSKDQIRVDGGRLKSNKARGLWLSLGANVPNILLALLTGIGALINTAFGQSMSIICDIISRFLNNMYFGIMNFLEYTIYRDPLVLKARSILGATSYHSPELSKAAELIENPSYTILDITKAAELVAENTSGTDATLNEALELLNTASQSPRIIENWWWFLAIVIPALVVGWLAYWLGSKNFRILSIFGINPKPSNANRK